MLGIAPKRFDTVDLLRTAGKLIVTMTHSEMLRKAHVNQSLITVPTVGIDYALDTEIWPLLINFCSVALEASGTISV